MNTVRWIVAIAALAASSLVGAQPAPDGGAQVPQPARLVLYARFEAAAHHDWVPVALDLVPGGWHVGSSDGPPADEAQLRAVLSRLTDLAIGGRCRLAQTPGETPPCTFRFTQTDFAGLAQDPAGEFPEGWFCATGSTLLTADGVTAYPRLTASGRFGLASSDAASTRVAVVQAPGRFLGDRGAAYGQSIRFRFQVPRDEAGRTSFDASQGLVILSSDGRLPTWIPRNAGKRT